MIRNSSCVAADYIDITSLYPGCPPPTVTVKANTGWYMVYSCPWHSTDVLQLVDPSFHVRKDSASQWHVAVHLVTTTNNINGPIPCKYNFTSY